MLATEILRTVFAVTPYLFILSFLLLATNVTYNLFFHPLRAFPGPLLYRALRIPFLLRLVRGTLCRDMLALHDRYGPVVRVAPNELAFADPAAWRDIMQPTTTTTATSSSGSKTGAGLPEIGKWNEHYRARDGGAINILSAPPEEHARLRRQMAGGFSERGMRAQEPILQRYVDLLVRRLREGCEVGGGGGGGGGGSNKPVDMVQWLNFTVFDLIGDLAFGESFGCLESSAYHPWVRPVTEVSALSAALPVVSHYPLVKKVAMNMLFTLFGGKLEGYMTETKNKLLRRMEVDRADLIQGLLKNQEGGGMSFAELLSNASIFVLAGSETSATTLAGELYYLTKNPTKLDKLCREVRGAFEREGDITLMNLNRLEYMSACLQETMRLYPPVPNGLPRIVPEGGREICGHFVPEDTHVAIWQWAMYHRSALFTDPFLFHPERFLGDSRYASDNKEALQPFHVGPRSCIGRTLAYAEMKLILARLLFNFDLTLAEESTGWMDNQKAYNLWSKPPLFMHLTPRQ